MRNICNPQAITDRLPPGEALVQVLLTPPVAGTTGHVPTAVRLGPAGSHECGETYLSAFRRGGRAYGVRVWTARGRLSRDSKQQVEAILRNFRDL